MKRAAKLALASLDDFSQPVVERNEARIAREHDELVGSAHERGYQRGFAAGQSAANALFEQRLHDLIERLEAEKQAAKSQWQNEIGKQLGEAVEIGIASLSRQLKERIALLLKPLLVASLHRRAVNDFNQVVDQVIEGAAAIEIIGPDALVRGIEERIGLKTRIGSVTVDETASVSIKCDNTVVSANFSAWTEQLEGQFE